MQNLPNNNNNNNKRTHEQSIKEEYKGDLASQHQFQNSQANGQDQYENDNPDHVIDKNSQIWWCIDCDKKYKSYPAFYTHNKIKHNGNPPSKYRIPRALDAISKDRGRPRADNNPKMKFTTEDKAQHNLEDNLFDFLGNLGSKESSNTIIREYLKKPLDASEVLDKIKNTLCSRKNIIHIYSFIEFEFRRLNQVLKDHENDEFIDPLDIDPDTQDDISLYNIKGLFNYMRDQKMLNRFSILVIFLAWLGKELTENSLKEVLIICIEYFSYFSMYLDQKGSSQSKQIESRDAATNSVRQLYESNQYSFTLLKKFDEAKKLVEFFHQWYCNYEKMITQYVQQQPPMQQQPQIPPQQIRIPQQIQQHHPMQYQQLQMIQPPILSMMDQNQMLNNQ